MTIWVTPNCDCRQDIGIGQKREMRCKHGNVFVKADAKGEPTRPRRSREPERDWSVAHSKVEEEGCCRICKRSADEVKLEKAHILGREHDEPRTEGSNVLFVHPLRIIPACGPFPSGCHGDIDYRRINVLPYLTLEEQLQAVRDAGGIEAARIRLEPVTHREEVEANSVVIS